jgi:hypothetical protein
MKLADLIRGSFGEAATAIPAIPAIRAEESGRKTHSVAGIATVAATRTPQPVRPQRLALAPTVVRYDQLLAEVADPYGCTLEERADMAAAANCDPDGTGKCFRAILWSSDNQRTNSPRLRTVTSCAPTDYFQEWSRNCASVPHWKLTSRPRKRVTPRRRGRSLGQGVRPTACFGALRRN